MTPIRISDAMVSDLQVQCHADVVGPNLAENREVNRWA